MFDDAECLNRYAELRDQSAFSDFVHRNLRLVYSAAYRQTNGDAHSAQDITQTVFSTAAQHAKALSRHPVIAAWLHQTTRNATIDALRARQRRQAREQVVSAMNEAFETSGDQPDWDKISPELDKVVAALSETDREAIILRFFGEKSFLEIGQKLRLSENAARMRVDRALDKLRVGLSRKGIVSTGAALSVLLADKAAIAAPTGLGAATVATAISVPAATGLISIIGTLKIMSITKVIAGIATAVAVVSLSTALHEYRAARAAEQTVIDLQKIAQAKNVAETPPQPEPTKAEPRKGATTQTVSASAKLAPDNPLAPVLAILSNPGIQAQASIQTKIRLDTQFATFFKKLSLPPETLDQFKNLIVEKQMVAYDSISVANDQGINPFADAQGFMQVVMASEKNVDGQIATLLGESGFKQFLDYQNTVPARNTVAIFGQALSFTSAPLSEPLSEQVVNVLTEHGTPGMPPSNPFAILNADMGVVKLSDRGRAQLQEMLTPAQMRVLEEKVQQQAQLLEARSRIGNPQK